MKAVTRILLGVITLVLISVIAGIVLDLSTPQRTVPLPPSGDRPLALAGKTAPDFRLRSSDGTHLALSEFRGKIIVLNFWATWCLPCREEMPNLERIWTEYRSQGVIVLGLDVQDDWDDAVAFSRKLKVSYPILHDPEQTRMTAYEVTALPTTVFIGRDMRIRNRFVGGYQGSDGYRRLREQIASFLR